VRGSSQAAEDSLLSKQQGPGADGEEGTFFFGILLLEVREGSDNAQGLGFIFDDGVGGSARDNEDVKFGEALVSFLIFDVCAEGGTLSGDGVFGGRNECCREGLGS